MKALTVGCVRRCPTLPPSLAGSTIGAGGLSFRVRNGSGRFPSAVAAVTSVKNTPWWFLFVLRGCLFFQKGIVDALAVWLRLVVVSPRPISTSQLNTLRCVHFWPINPMVWWGALTPRWGWETSSGSGFPA